MEALTPFREHAAEIRAVLLDLWMPGMSGKAACEEISWTHPGTRILLMTAINEPLAQVGMAGLPVAGFLSKPFRHAELQAKLREVVEGIGNPPEREEGMRQRSQEVGHRRFVRLLVSVPVVGRAARFGDTEVHGTVWNIGGGGLMTKCPVRIVPGSVVDLVLQRRHGPLTVEGRVVCTSGTGTGFATASLSETPNGPASPWTSSSMNIPTELADGSRRHGGLVGHAGGGSA